jgi:hypothetical protein
MMFSLRQSFRRAKATAKRRDFVKLNLEALEERWMPDATTDTLIWNPQGGSTDASLQTNWYDQTQSKQGVIAPTATNLVILMNSNSMVPNANSPIEFTAAEDVKSLNVWTGYQNTMTIDDGATVTTWANNIIQGARPSRLSRRMPLASPWSIRTTSPFSPRGP